MVMLMVFSVLWNKTTKKGILFKGRKTGKPMSTHRHEAKLDLAVLHQKVVNVIVICAHKS